MIDALQKQASALQAEIDKLFATGPYEATARLEDIVRALRSLARDVQPEPDENPERNCSEPRALDQ